MMSGSELLKNESLVVNKNNHRIYQKIIL